MARSAPRRSSPAATAASPSATASPRAPNRDLYVQGNRRAYIRNGALGTVVALGHGDVPEHDTITVDFDGIGTIELPHSSFDHHRNRGGRREVGIDHAYALTSYAVQGSTHDVATSRVDSTTTRAETYVDSTRGRLANHLYLTTSTDPLDGEVLPKLPPAPRTKPSPTASNVQPAS